MVKWRRQRREIDRGKSDVKMMRRMRRKMMEEEEWERRRRMVKVSKQRS